jgi:hypothetical protein
LLNLEFRFPLINFLQLGLPPITLGNIRGVLFTDIGTVLQTKDTWVEGEFRKANKWIPTKDGRFNDVVFGYGFGSRIYFLGLLFKYDLAYRAYTTNFSEISPPIHYFSMGLDF